jgi:N-acetylmuramoyl-L-alanine amidase
MCIYILLLTLLPIQTWALELDKDRIDHINMLIDNEPLELNEPTYLKNGRLFIPIRSIVESLGGTINWKPDEQQIFLSTASGDTLMFTVGIPQMIFNDRVYIMDVKPFMIEDRMYIPLRHAAEFLHTDVTWNATTLTASFTSIPLYTVEEGDSLTSISEKFNISESLLLERNSNLDADWQTGDILKISIPDIMEHKLAVPKPESIQVTASIESNPDYILLAKIIQVEVGYESYEAQLAVGSVIMNRVNDKRFPNTIHDVIYQRGQFPPAHNGLLAKSKPNESVLRAAKAVLNGENNVKGAVYFYNPKVTKGKFWSSLTLIEKIGNHRYVK